MDNHRQISYPPENREPDLRSDRYEVSHDTSYSKHYRPEHDISQPSRYSNYQGRNRMPGPRYEADMGRPHEREYPGNLSAYEKERQVHFPETRMNKDPEGIHRGKGPKSYKRSDDRVREIV